VEDVCGELRGAGGRWLRDERVRGGERRFSGRVLHDCGLRVRAARAKRAHGRTARAFRVVGAGLQANGRERHRTEELHGDQNEQRHGQATAAHLTMIAVQIVGSIWIKRLSPAWGRAEPRAACVPAAVAQR
jgi:hypothetical protein